MHKGIFYLSNKNKNICFYLSGWLKVLLLEGCGFHLSLLPFFSCSFRFFIIPSKFHYTQGNTTLHANTTIQNKHKISYQQWEFQVDVNCKSFQVLTNCGKIISLEKDTSSKSFMLDNSNKSVTSIYYCKGCLITFWGYGFDWQVTIVFFLK